MTDDAVSAARKALIDTIISMYHTTRIAGTPAADHILSKQIVQDAFDRLSAIAPVRTPIIMRPDRRTDAQALRTLADYIESDTHLKAGNKTSWSDVLEGVRRHYLTDKAALSHIGNGGEGASRKDNPNG